MVPRNTLLPVRTLLCYRSLTMVVASAAVMRVLLNHTSVAGLHTPTPAAPSTHSGKAEVPRSHLHGAGEGGSKRPYASYVRIMHRSYYRGDVLSRTYGTHKNLFTVVRYFY